MFDNKNHAPIIKLCCCCCIVEQRSYFKCFTLIILPIDFFWFITAIISIVRNPSLWTVLKEVIPIVSFPVVFYMMYVFCKRKEYGSYMNYSFSLFFFIFVILLVVGAIIIGIFLILGGVFISKIFKGLNLIGIPTSYLRTGITISYWLISIPLAIYYAYLCHEYLKVIQNERIRVQNGGKYKEYNDKAPMVDHN